MPDIAHVWGADLQFNASGDIVTVTADALTQQRILHRLLTNAGDYIWQLAFGAGLPAFVGRPPNAKAISGLVIQQLALEATVAQSPVPLVTAQKDQTGNLIVQVQYVDAQSNQTQILTFPVAP